VKCSSFVLARNVAVRSLWCCVAFAFLGTALAQSQPCRDTIFANNCGVAQSFGSLDCTDPKEATFCPVVDRYHVIPVPIHNCVDADSGTGCDTCVESGEEVKPQILEFECEFDGTCDTVIALDPYDSPWHDPCDTAELTACPCQN